MSTMGFGTVPPLCALKECIDDASSPIGMRMRAAYYLRHVHSSSSNKDDDKDEQQQKVISILAAGLVDQDHGSLMRHEFAYILGQCRDARGCKILEEVLENPNDCIMVRHECAEALGAIGEPHAQPILEQVRNLNAGLPELSETCQLALDVIEWRVSGDKEDEEPAACACMLHPYNSIDPAPPHPLHANMSAQELGAIILNTDLKMFQRYRAMFSLRNKGGAASVKALCAALIGDSSSALLRHEISYILGQMQHPASVEALEEVLRREDEHDMVRHESAEALGAIEGRWEEVEIILKEFSTDSNIVVRESCLVALDAADYWGHATATVNDDKVASFTQQKNAPPNRILVNHFNIEQE